MRINGAGARRDTNEHLDVAEDALELGINDGAGIGAPQVALVEAILAVAHELRIANIGHGFVEA